MNTTTKPATKTAERPQQQAAPPPPAESKGELVQFQKPRLPYHTGFEDAFGLSKGAWKVLVEATYPSARTVDSVVMAINYCKARGLDIFKKPVHIVPMWSSTARNEDGTTGGGYVETIWPSINELRTTAFRTGQYAGCDEAEFGPEIEKKFSGRTKVKGQWQDTEVTVKFPEWCRITVHRELGGRICKFVGPKVKWIETYATIGNSDVPNEMWQTRPEGQLEKCAEAAALRKAFPEEIGNQYAAEEMEGRRMIEEVQHAAVSASSTGGPPPPPEEAAPSQHAGTGAPGPLGAQKAGAAQSAAPKDQQPKAQQQKAKSAPPDDGPPLSAYEDAMGAHDPTPQTWGDDVVDGEFTEPEFDEAQWLKDLDGAYSGVEGLVTDLAEKQNQMAAPMKSKVSKEAWAKAQSIFMTHFQRLSGAV